MSQHQRQRHATNSTYVVVEVLNVAEDQCEVRIVGAAKEGVIKQRSAEKAVRRVIAHFWQGI